MMIFNQCIQSRLLTMVKSISSWHIICFFFRFNEWHHCLVCGAWPFVPPWLQYTFLRIDDINTLLNYLNNLGNMLASYVRARCAGQTLFVCSLHPNSTDREERRYFCPYEICTFLEGRSRVSGPNLWCLMRDILLWYFWVHSQFLRSLQWVPPLGQMDVTQHVWFGEKPRGVTWRT